MPLVGGRCLQRGAPAERRRPGSASAGGGRHAPPDVVALREPLDGDTWAVWVVGPQAMGRPLAGFHPVTVGEQPVQIQGAAGEDYGAIFCPAHELYGGGEARSAQDAPGARSREPSGPIALCSTRSSPWPSLSTAVKPHRLQGVCWSRAPALGRFAAPWPPPRVPERDHGAAGLHGSPGPE